MLLKSLVIATLTLIPFQSAYAATRCGMASHYGLGDGYGWRTMANGKPMNPQALTTAHRSLPFGTKLQVTNSANNRSVLVTVTDSGPYVGGRVLDLSYGAFSKIASPSSGVVGVCYSRVV